MLVVAGSIGVLFYLWTLNYNKLGNFSDYSIIVDAAGKFGAGLRPFRDFSTALQSLPIWLAYACERLFGPRYLSLAYGNLLLTLCLFFIIVHYARRVFAFPLAIMIAMAVCVASSLQHGIIWYNSIGLLLLSAIALKCADLLRVHAIRSRDALLLALLLLLIGMTKMNFLAIAVGTVIFFVLANAIGMPRPRSGKKIAVLTVLAVAVCCAPPFIESFANHVALSTWVREVILNPMSARVILVRVMFMPAFYFKEWAQWYPGTMLKGSVFCCLMVYGFLMYFAVVQFLGNQCRNFKALTIQIALICLFWGSTCLLVLTNMEIESLGLSFCLIGVASMLLSGQFPGDKWRKAIQSSAIVLVTYFLLVGSVSVARHSRISFLKNVFTGQKISNDGELGYFRGVEFSRQAAQGMVLMDEVLLKNKGLAVYWGPGLQMMNRVHGGVNDPAFPLWYQRDITVHDSDTPRLIEAIERSGAELFVADRFWYDFYYVMPDGLSSYLDRTWILEERDDRLVVFRKSVVGQSDAGAASRQLSAKSAPTLAGGKEY